MMGNVEGKHYGLAESNDLVSTLLVSIVAAIGSFIFIILPLIVAELEHGQSYSRSYAGFIGSAPLMGMFVGSLAFSKFMTRLIIRNFVIAGSLCLSGCYILTEFFLSTPAVLIVIQFFAGVCGVSLMSSGFSIFSSSRNPERNFALFITVQMSMGALLIPALQQLITAFGLSACLIALSILSGIPIALAGRFPQRSARHAHPASDGSAAFSATSAAASIVAQCLFGIAIMFIWSDVSVITVQRGWSPDFAASSISFSLIASIAGAVCAMILNSFLPRRWIMIVGTIMLVAAITGISGATTKALFTSSMIAFGFCWNILPPFQLGIASEIDAAGRVVVLNLASVKFGYAVGAGLRGVIPQATSKETEIAIAAICLISSLCLVALIDKRIFLQNKRQVNR